MKQQVKEREDFSTVTLYLPNWIIEKISKTAEEERRSVSKQATVILERALKA